MVKTEHEETVDARNALVVLTEKDCCCQDRICGGGVNGFMFAGMQSFNFGTA